MELGAARHDCTIIKLLRNAHSRGEFVDKKYKAE